MKIIIIATKHEAPLFKQPLWGKPLFMYVTEACMEADTGDITILHDIENEAVFASLPASVRRDVSEACSDDALVLYADMPLVTADAIKRRINEGHIAESDIDLFTRAGTQAVLAEAGRVLREQINARHMANGVRMMDPATVYIDADTTIEPGVMLYPGVILEGCCVIGYDAIIGPNTRMTNTSVGAGSTVQYSVLADARVGCKTDIGPFAYLRPHAVIGDYCKVGDFVEVKNARVGSHTKASHLAYIGDADIGEHVNFSCGAITVNYDSKQKHRTTVKDRAFVGCNSNLVAPVTVGEGAFVAAGSTITDDIPADTLAIARQRQTNKPDWQRK